MAIPLLLALLDNKFLWSSGYLIQDCTNIFRASSVPLYNATFSVKYLLEQFAYSFLNRIPVWLNVYFPSAIFMLWV